MFSLIHGKGLDIITREGITLLIAFVIAELFYKFHSFVLECGAFLVTWYVLGAVASFVMRALGRDSRAAR